MKHFLILLAVFGIALSSSTTHALTDEERIDGLREVASMADRFWQGDLVGNDYIDALDYLWLAESAYDSLARAGTTAGDVDAINEGLDGYQKALDKEREVRDALNGFGHEGGG